MVVPVKERLLEKNNILLSLIFYDILFRKVREVTYIVTQRFEYCLISKGKNLLLYFLNKTLKGIRNYSLFFFKNGSRYPVSNIVIFYFVATIFIITCTNSTIIPTVQFLRVFYVMSYRQQT